MCVRRDLVLYAGLVVIRGCRLSRVFYAGFVEGTFGVRVCIPTPGRLPILAHRHIICALWADESRHFRVGAVAQRPCLERYPDLNRGTVMHA